MNYFNAEWDRWFVIGVAGRGDPSIGFSTSNTNFFASVLHASALPLHAR
jgi:elastase-2